VGEEDERIRLKVSSKADLPPLPKMDLAPKEKEAQKKRSRPDGKPSNNEDKWPDECQARRVSATVRAEEPGTSGKGSGEGGGRRRGSSAPGRRLAGPD